MYEEEIFMRDEWKWKMRRRLLHDEP